MALKLDNALLEELGLGQLPDSEKQLLLSQIYEKLEMNVGMRLADQMSNEQLDAFEKFVDASDDKGAFQWLESNFPNYKSVVNEEFEKLKAEIHSVAPQILASALEQQQAVGSGGGQPIQPQQYAQQPVQQFQGQPAPTQQMPTNPAQSQTPPHYNQQPSYPSQPGVQHQAPYPAPPQQPYPPQQVQYPPTNRPATAQAGHLQPQYGQPPAAAQQPIQNQPSPYQYPQQQTSSVDAQPVSQQAPQYPQYPPQQPPAGPAQ